MRNIALVFVVFLAACGSTGGNQPNLPSGVEVCNHDYDEAFSFQYQGDVIRYQQTLFGQMTYIYEFTTPSGEKVYLNEQQLDNYDCF